MNQSIFTFEKLYRAYLDCRKTKRKTINALKFEWNLERNLFRLQKELETKTYQIGRSICFVVKDPSPREIFAAEFRDRVVHHLLVNEILGVGEKNFIFDSFACRKNKGTHLAVKRLKIFIRKVAENHKKEAYYLKLDISGFFMSIDHNILYTLIKKLVLKQKRPRQWEEDILWLAKIIIFHKPTCNYVIKGDFSLFKLIPPRRSLFDSPEGKGLPIGNYSSQFFANLYLNELDQFVKREICCKYYVRYVDDFILLNLDKEQIKSWRDKIKVFLERNLELGLSVEKQKIQPLKTGIEFLGYFVKLDYVLVRRRVVARLKSKLRKSSAESVSQEKMLATINSYYGHFRHAFSFNLRKDIFEYHLGRLRAGFYPARDYVCLKVFKN